MTIRQVWREENRWRTQRTKAKIAEIKHNDDEVTRVVAALEAEQRTRRQQQAIEAREALEGRRRQRPTGRAARVNLVRHECTTVAATPTDSDDGVSVEAGDGLPTAAMLVDGVQQNVKIDSGARYSVAGTDWMAPGEKKSTRAPVTYIEGIWWLFVGCLGRMDL
ncbi:hypothetical protein PHMEG_00027733 [Phytophthora megakarya]|uniref:Uncharacterized protein n=1 Tax=Phytophthora megakarya TaxID=4795 RepID=A0A225V7U3_9STRA|nr:hypothetical protein PHMEG_00027733 [Phytophthora megakarya]